MDIENIIEGNRIIAEFMGGKYDIKDFNSLGYIFIKLDNEEYQHLLPEMIKYYSSWEWLMPVVEKILKVVFNDGEYCYLRTFGMIHEGTHQYMVRFNRYSLHSADTLIEATWMAVIEFIKST